MWSPLQLCLVTHTGGPAGHGLLPVPAPHFCLQSPRMAEGWSGMGKLGLPPPLHRLPFSGKYSACCLLQQRPGKSRVALERIVRDLGEFDTSFRINELTPFTSHVSMKLWSKNQGHSQGSKTLHVTLPSCHFLFCSGGSLQSAVCSPPCWFFPFPTTGGLTSWGVIRLMPRPRRRTRKE